MRILCGLLPVLLIVSASICTNAWAQSRPSSPGGITFERITMAEGEASFSRSFRKVYGVSPSDYAEQEG